jgi:uncharacterized protein YoxC
MAETHVNVFIEEAKAARQAVDAALEDFKQKVEVVKTKVAQAVDDVEPAVAEVVKELEAEVEKLFAKGKEKKAKKPKEGAGK